MSVRILTSFFLINKKLLNQAITYNSLDSKTLSIWSFLRPNIGVKFHEGYIDEVFRVVA